MSYERRRGILSDAHRLDQHNEDRHPLARYLIAGPQIRAGLLVFVHQRNPACWFRGTGPYGLCRPGYKYLALTFGTLLSSQGADAHPSGPFDRSGGNPRNATRSGSRCQNRPSRPVRPDFHRLRPLASGRMHALRCTRSVRRSGLTRGRPAAGLSSCSLSDSPRASTKLPTDDSPCKSAGHCLSSSVCGGHGDPGGTARPGGTVSAGDADHSAADPDPLNVHRTRFARV
jgi:hypothetical protein